MKRLNDPYIFVLACISAALLVVLISHAFFTNMLVLPFGRVQYYDFVDSSEKEVQKNYFIRYLDRKNDLMRFAARNTFMFGDSRLPLIALTFDDGPHPYMTRKLLDLLDREGIKATFFLVGKNVLKYPQLAKMINERGHLIGNHTYNHPDMTQLSISEAAVEIKACGKVINLITGTTPHLFRPPGGNFNVDLLIMAQSLGYIPVLWTANAGDASGIGKGAIESRVYTRINKGGIILMHDGVQKTLDLLPGVIAELRQKGYKFVTIDQLRVAEKEALRKKGPVRRGPRAVRSSVTSEPATAEIKVLSKAMPKVMYVGTKEL